MNSFESDRRPAASSALLSAALGGLLCLTPSCRPDPTHGSDTGPNADASASDTPTTPDVGPVDSPAPVDVARDEAAPDVESDAGEVDVAAVDSSSPDATADDVLALDATLDVTIVDAGPADDASTLDVALLDAIPPCDVQEDRVITYTDSASDVSFESFTALCTTRGGHVEIAPHCGGFNTCAGFSYDQTRETWTEHTCAGLNTCTGYSCVIP